MCLLMVAIVSFTLIACGEKTVQEEPSNQSLDNETTEMNTESTSKNLGEYTLSECISSDRVYIKYNDGSFDRYGAGGYCRKFSMGSGFYGMYLPDKYLKYTTTLNLSNDERKLVVFASGEYSLTLHPVHAEVAVFTTSKDDVIGYGHIGQITDRGVTIDIIYSNHEWEDIFATYIDGKPATEYEAEILEWYAYPYSGATSVDVYCRLEGFKKGTTVTLGVVEGSTLVEKQYEVDATYYDCDPQHNNWQDEDIYYLECIATPEGYAEVDLTGVPAGKYVMLYDYDGYYCATVLTIER